MLAPCRAVCHRLRMLSDRSTRRLVVQEAHSIVPDRRHSSDTDVLFAVDAAVS